MDKRCRNRVCHHITILNHTSLVLPINVNEENLDGDNQLKLAVKHNHLGAIRNLMQSPNLNINHQGPNGLTALHMLSVQTDPFRTIALQLLSTRGADPNLQTSNGSTPLYLAVHKASADRDDSPEYVNLLQAYGADPDILDPHGYSPLIYACLSNLPNIVLALLYGRANPNLLDNHGYSALYYASTHGYIDIVHCLLGFGADPNFVERRTGESILSKNTKPEILKLLIQHGANPYIAGTINNPLIRLTYQMHIRKAKGIIQKTMMNAMPGSAIHGMINSNMYEPQVWDLILTYLFGDIALV